MGLFKNEKILEYEIETECNTMTYSSNGKKQYLGSAIDKWLLPQKVYSIPTGIKMWLPEDSIAVITNCPWLSPKLEVISQIVVNDGAINIQVRNLGYLPTKILKEEILASLHIIPRMECHVIESKNY